MPTHIEKETGVSPHIGLLDRPYALDSDEKGNIIIDQLPLDYSILEETDYRYPTESAYFGYMTRGCINRCSFCAVPRLEPEYQNYIPLHENLKKIEECFGAKKDLLLMDNNVFASDRFDQIVDEIKECGFANGSYYVPPSEYDIAFHNFCEGFNLSTEIGKCMFNSRAYSRKLISVYDEIAGRISNSEDKGNFYQRREELGLLFPESVTRESVIALHELAKPLHDKHFKKFKRIRFIDFNQGLDGRLADADKMKKVSEIAIRPLRIAFDHWSMKDTYVQSIKTAAEYGIKNLSNYLLYNFKDHPDELYNRMRLNIDLCEDLEVTIYSFPMKYHPIDDPAYFRNRDYIGTPHWNRKFIRSIQAVLNSTHGKIGRGRSFFEAAFGKNLDEFHKILWMPEALIIQRYKYDMQKRHEYFGNKPTPYDNIDDQTGNTTAEWWTKFCALNSEQRASIEPIIAEHSFSQADITVTDPQIAEVLRYYQIQRDGK